jgi:two-component system aerobic respiration control sensor histidine kinase ArcB
MSFENEELYLIIDNIDASVYWKDTSGRYLGCNKYMLLMSGFSTRDKLIGKKDSDMPWFKIADELRAIDISVLKNGIFEGEETPLTASKRKIIFHTKKTILFDNQKKVIGIIGVSMDITKKKKAEILLKKNQAQLLEEKNKAQAANQAKSEFLRNMEHQLRTPFSGIYSIVEMLAQSETDPEKKALLELTYCSAKELLDLLNDIIDFSRNLSEPTAIISKKFDLKILVRKAITMQQATANKKGLELSFEYDSNLPTIFLSDPNRLRRIILNLLSNAIRFTEKGGVSIKVSLGKHLDEKNLILQLIITDTGIGISPDVQPLIYEKFYRVYPANQNKYLGAGLGLHVVKELITDLEGEIDVTSTPNKGTTFVCTLPFKRPLLDNIINEQDP